MKKLMREPLVHFLLLGAAIFVAYSSVSKRTSGEPGKIVVTQGQLASMRVSFTRTWQRPPTSEEWEGLIRDRVREEVYYREALALGLVDALGEEADARARLAALAVPAPEYAAWRASMPQASCVDQVLAPGASSGRQRRQGR